MPDQIQSPMLASLAARGWSAAMAQMAEALDQSDSPDLRKLIESAMRKVASEATIDEVLQLFGQLLDGRTEPLDAGNTLWSIRSLVMRLLLEVAPSATPSGVPGQTPTTMSLKAAQITELWDLENRLLEIVAARGMEFYLELGESPRDLLAHRYGVTPPGTTKPYEPSSSDRVRLAASFQRLLWAYVLTAGFTRKTNAWRGQPAPVGVARTSGGHYVSRQTQAGFLRSIASNRPDIIRSLRPDLRAALAQHRDFAFVGEFDFTPGARPEMAAFTERVHEALLEVLWEVFRSRTQ